EVVSYLRLKAPDIKIVLDPVLKASAGYAFHDWENGLNKLEPVLRQVDLITPNYPEMMNLAGEAYPELSGKQEYMEQVLTIAKAWAAHCPVLLKGGHLQENKGTDYLFEHNQLHELKPDINLIYPK